MKRQPPCSEATKRKISLALSGKKVSEETRARMSAAKKIARHSEETKAKMRASQALRRERDKMAAQQGVADNMTAPKRTQTPEHIAKIKETKRLNRLKKMLSESSDKVETDIMVQIDEFIKFPEVEAADRDIEPEEYADLLERLGISIEPTPISLQDAEIAFLKSLSNDQIKEIFESIPELCSQAKTRLDLYRQEEIENLIYERDCRYAQQSHTENRLAEIDDQLSVLETK